MRFLWRRNKKTQELEVEVVRVDMASYKNAPKGSNNNQSTGGARARPTKRVRHRTGAQRDTR